MYVYNFISDRRNVKCSRNVDIKWLINSIADLISDHKIESYSQKSYSQVENTSLIIKKVYSPLHKKWTPKLIQRIIMKFFLEHSLKFEMKNSLKYMW